MTASETPIEIVDVQFSLSGRALPADYADALWQALRSILPWFEAESDAGVHPVSGLSSGDGEWYLSRRSRLSLRLARTQAEAAAEALEGRHLSLCGHELALGESAIRPLAYSPAIHARFVAMTPAADTPIDEADFLAACQAELDGRGIRAKTICGKPQRMRVPAGLLSGFSLMLHDLEREANLRLQYEGLGIERKRGCGIFVPHKPGAAVKTLE